MANIVRFAFYATKAAFEEKKDLHFYDVVFIEDIASIYTHGKYFCESNNNTLSNAAPNIFVVSSSDVQDNLSELVEKLSLQVNDIVLLSDNINATIKYSSNGNVRSLKCNPDYDIPFRYVGDGEFKAISLPIIL